MSDDAITTVALLFGGYIIGSVAFALWQNWRDR